MKETLDLEERDGVYSLRGVTPIYNLIKPGQKDFYNVDDFNANADIIEHELDNHSNQIGILKDDAVQNKGGVNSNLDVITTPSEGYSNNATGQPTASTGWWKHLSWKGNNGYAVQQFFARATKGMYFRFKENGTWDSVWKQVATTDMLDWKPDNWKTDTDPPSSYPNYSTTAFYSAGEFGGVNYALVTTNRYVVGVARQVLSSTNGRAIKYRLARTNTEWGEWHTIATTTKTEILCTPKPGYKIHSQKSYIVNNEVFLDVTIMREDGGNFPINERTNTMFTVPSLYKPKSALLHSLSSSRMDALGSLLGNLSVSIYTYTGDVFVSNPTIDNIKQINVSGSYLI